MKLKLKEVIIVFEFILEGSSCNKFICKSSHTVYAKKDLVHWYKASDKEWLDRAVAQFKESNKHTMFGPNYISVTRSYE